jgi:heme-degrading monooxygenase HmoA
MSLHEHMKQHEAVQKGRTPMYARITISQLQPGKIDEGIQILRDSILPATRQQQGFKGALHLTDRSQNKTITIGLWETEADLRAVEISGFYQAQIAKVASLLAAQPVREVYEVGIQEMQKDGSPTYARVLTATAQPGKTDELISIARDSILPAARQQHGFNSMLLLNDRTTGKGISITLWETEADLLAGETSGYLREQLGKLANVLATQVVREAYEVSIQE